MTRHPFVRVVMMMSLALALLWSLPFWAEAKRLGGGKSFGSSPQYERSAPRPATPQRDAAAPQRQTQQSQQGFKRPGFLGGMGGMLGGMLVGGLLGSLLFGGMGHGYGGPGLLDLLLVGGGLYLLFRFLRSRRTAVQAAGPMSYEERPPSSFRSLPGGQPGGSIAPEGFDEEEFLSGAKTAYVRLQAAWDRRDLDDIKNFATSEVLEEIRAQAMQDPASGKTEIMLLNADLVEVKTVAGREVASVLFDVMLRETAEEVSAKNVKEIWHFSRELGNKASFWVLEGIQQVNEA